MADISITHTRLGGTVITGSVRDDGVWDVLKAQPYRWRSSQRVGLYIPQSRDKAAKTWIIDSAAAALRAAGHTVTVALDDTTPGRTRDEIEDDRAGRAAGRIERREDYAASAAASGQAAYARYRQTADNWPMGQPLVSDQARRVHKRMHADHDRAADEFDRAGYHAGRAAATEAEQAHHESIPATLRRITALEVRERSLARTIAGQPDWMDNGQGGHKLALVRPQGGHLASLEADLAQVRADLDYWREYVAQAQARGARVWGPADFERDDFALYRGTWYQVQRVNPKSLTVMWGTNTHLLAVVTRDNVRHAMGPSTRTHTVTYDDIRGRRSAAEMALAEYLDAKHAYEDLVTAWGGTMTPGDPVPENVKQAEAQVAQLKAAGGYGGPDDAACCRKYGFLHEPAFARPGCQWHEPAPETTDAATAQEG